jgi:hypothetical protein
MSKMKCNYCKKILSDDADVSFNYFQHLEINHYAVLSAEDKIMHDIRKKMLQSKKDYELKKKNVGDSDLIFNAKNSEI